MELFVSKVVPSKFDFCNPRPGVHRPIVAVIYPGLAAAVPERRGHVHRTHVSRIVNVGGRRRNIPVRVDVQRAHTDRIVQRLDECHPHIDDAY